MSKMLLKSADKFMRYEIEVSPSLHLRPVISAAFTEHEKRKREREVRERER